MKKLSKNKLYFIKLISVVLGIAMIQLLKILYEAGYINMTAAVIITPVLIFSVDWIFSWKSDQNNNASKPSKASENLKKLSKGQLRLIQFITFILGIAAMLSINSFFHSDSLSPLILIFVSGGLIRLFVSWTLDLKSDEKEHK